MQTVFRNWKESLTSEVVNKIFLGILEPGRYRGFDVMVPTGLNIVINHSLTGILQTKQDLSQTSRVGVLYTKQGNIIQEDDQISGLTVTTNASNAFTRRDIVVCSHQHTNVIGGQAATYSIIRGTDGVTTAPSLTNPNWQTLIGTIVIPASASDLSGATWEPSKVPALGGIPSFLENFSEFNNNFITKNTENKLDGDDFRILTTPNSTNVASLISSGKLILPIKGNIFYSGSGTIDTIGFIDGETNSRKGFKLTLVGSGGTLNINLGGSVDSGCYPVKCDILTTNNINTITLTGYESIELLWATTHWTVSYSNDFMLSLLMPTITPGEVRVFASNSAPTGFLKANGAAISRTTYSRLFNIIGTTFGVGNGTTTFNLPDLRGEFVRGWDDGRGIDAARVFGSSQAEELKAHVHAQKASVTQTGVSGSYGRYADAGSGDGGTGSGFDTGSTGGTETRPRNIALLYCIKY